MLKTISIAFMIPFLALFGNGSGHLFSGHKHATPGGNTGTLEKMIVASGDVAMDINLNRLNGTGSVAKESKPSVLRFNVEQNSFFTVLVFNDELRGPLPGSMGLIPQSSEALPAKLNASYKQLVVENLPWGKDFEMVVRDAKTGFAFFNIEGHEFNYNADQRLMSI